MSKLFSMEPRHEQRKLELAQQAEARAEIDSEAALHMELLAETDAKLDRINARLDRFVHELNRLSDAQRRESAAAPQPLPLPERDGGSPVMSFVLLLLLGLMGWAGYVLWQGGDLSLEVPETALHQWLVGEPVTSLIEDAPKPALAPNTPPTPPISLGDPASRATAARVTDVPDGPQVEIVRPAPPARAVEQSAAVPATDEPEAPAGPPAAMADAAQEPGGEIPRLPAALMMAVPVTMVEHRREPHGLISTTARLTVKWCLLPFRLIGAFFRGLW